MNGFSLRRFCLGQAKQSGIKHSDLLPGLGLDVPASRAGKDFGFKVMGRAGSGDGRRSELVFFRIVEGQIEDPTREAGASTNPDL